MISLNYFQNQYAVAKTLCLELRPIGKTMEYIISSGILKEDEHRNESYKLVKKIIDDYHKAYIELSLSRFELKITSCSKNDALEDFYCQYLANSQEEKDKNIFKKTQDNLRKQIAKHLTQGEAYKRIDKKELIQEDLLEFVAADPDAANKKILINEFRDFTTYFTGFYENRKNMYSEEAQSTAIAYRIIHENLPKFIDNMGTFKQLMQSSITDILPQIFDNFKKDLEVSSIQEIFDLNYFNKVLTQKQIDIYNAIIGGKSLNENSRIQGLNEYINLYNQQHKENKLPLLKLLFKQILSDRNSLSWLPEAFETDKQVLHAVRKCYANLKESVLHEAGLVQLLSSLPSYDSTRIYIRNDQALTTISQKLFGDWGIIPHAIKERLKKDISAKRKETEEAYLERIEKAFKQADSYTIAYINDSLKEIGVDKKNIEDYFIHLGAICAEGQEQENILQRIASAYSQAQPLLEEKVPVHKNLMQDKDSVELIKSLLDELKNLQHFIKPLLGKGSESDKDERFYGEFVGLWNELDQITTLYNKVRNYVTRKPYSTEKFKINFQNATLLKGWDRNKERDNTSIILRKNGLYYLAIMRKEYNKVFEKYPAGTEGNCYEKMEYKLLPGANKMLPKVFFSKSRINEFNPSPQLLQNYQMGTHKKGDQFKKEDCHALIDFFKTSIEKHEDWKNFNFQFSPTSVYEDMSGFYREVEQQGYKLVFRSIDAEYIDKLVEEGKIFLFQIYNKDFSPFSKGTPNLHTLYWKMLFDERNLNNVVYKLNGEAEIFFRKKSITYTNPTHPAEIPIKNKNVQNKKKESVFRYDLIKNHRFTIDSFQFHVPITMNFKNAGLSNLNEQVYTYLRENKDAHIIGIDRGERHLLYLVVIDRYGRIVKQFSLNEIVNEYHGNTYTTNYHDLLDKREEARQQARQSWQSIENIKELKEGYLSQVVHKIANLMVEYHAIVVLEDLNIGFMRGRQKVEKQVYQKFEKMLIDKLNYLVDKKKAPEADGGLLKAFQLTNQFESFQKLGKQSGFLFYVPAWNTSKIDPCTGFTNLLDTRYENIAKAQKFFRTFDAIRYNAVKDYFELELDYDKFHKRAEGTQTKWTLCTYGTRIKTFRNPENNNQWDNVEINLTEEFKKLFKQFEINLSGDLQQAICAQTEKSFFESLLRLLKLTLQMRNSITGTDVDYLLSPVQNAEGYFYDSRKGDKSLPANADANGAYNIARKGLWVIQQIKQTPQGQKAKLSISNKEWLKFAQEKPYLKD